RGYRQARGAIGSRGAEGRDFAALAGGSDTGGFVAAYATLAANLFAVTAAFQALQKAAQTEQLRKGLELVGAQAGISLTLVSKKLQTITGDAISATDAMRATALGVSGGLNPKMLENLTTIAKGAASALGRDMGDSLDRLVRGVVKLEPELLDELGIMVRLDDAVDKYAKQQGKLASQLTKTERQQAFANAVAEQGLDKYKDIADRIPVNAFDQLAASVRTLGTDLLQLVANILTPFINLLAKAPALALIPLTAVLGSAASKVIPSFGASLEDLTNKMERVTAKTEYFAKVSKDAIAEQKNIKRDIGAGIGKVYTGDEAKTVGKGIFSQDQTKRGEIISKLQSDHLELGKQIEIEKAKGTAADTKALAALEQRKKDLNNIIQNEKFITIEKQKQAAAEVQVNNLKKEGILLTQQQVVFADIQEAFARGPVSGIKGLFQGIGVAFGQEMDNFTQAGLKASEKSGKVVSTAVKGFSKIGGVVSGATRAIGLLGGGISMLLGPISALLMGFQAIVGIIDLITAGQREADKAAKDFADSLKQQNIEITKLSKAGKGGQAFDALINQAKALRDDLDKTIDEVKKSSIEIPRLLSRGRFEVNAAPTVNPFSGMNISEGIKQYGSLEQKLKDLNATSIETEKIEAVLQSTLATSGEAAVDAAIAEIGLAKSREQALTIARNLLDKNANITSSYRDLADSGKAVTDAFAEFNKVTTTPMDKIAASINDNSNSINKFFTDLKNNTIDTKTTIDVFSQYIKDNPLDKFTEQMNQLILMGADTKTMQDAIDNYSKLADTLRIYSYIQAMPPGLIKDNMMKVILKEFRVALENSAESTTKAKTETDALKDSYLNLSAAASRASSAVSTAESNLKVAQTTQQIAEELDKVNKLKLEGIDIDKGISAISDQTKFLSTYKEEIDLLAKRRAEIVANNDAKVKELQQKAANKTATQAEIKSINAQIDAENARRDAATGAIDQEKRILESKKTSFELIIEYYNGEKYLRSEKLKDEEKLLDLIKEQTSATSDLRTAQLEGRRRGLERQAALQGRNLTAKEEYDLAKQEHEDKIAFLEDQIRNFETETTLKEQILGLNYETARLEYENAIKNSKDERAKELGRNILSSTDAKYYEQLLATEILRGTQLQLYKQQLSNEKANTPPTTTDNTIARMLEAQRQMSINKATLGAAGFMPPQMQKAFDTVLNQISGGDSVRVLELLSNPAMVANIQNTAAALSTMNTYLDGTQQIMDSVYSSFTDAFASIIDGSKKSSEAFKDMGKAILATIARVITELLVQLAIETAIAAIRTLMGAPPIPAAAGGTIPGAAKGVKPRSSTIGLANGGIIPMAIGGVMNRASGVEGIIRQPTYLVGEGRYNEAVVPLPNGRAIPVQMHGQGTSQQNNVSVNVNMSSNGQTTTQTEGMDMNNLGRAIATAVQKELQAQKMPGGMLNRYGAA
ncbi:hypothetical protein EBZ38_01805, partial [bacterium]|nr:hypothetical protein [bacterium]